MKTNQRLATTPDVSLGHESLGARRLSLQQSWTSLIGNFQRIRRQSGRAAKGLALDLEAALSGSRSQRYGQSN